MVKKCSDKNVISGDLSGPQKVEKSCDIDPNSLSARSSISSTATTLIKRNSSNDMNSFLTPRTPFSDILNRSNQENDTFTPSKFAEKNPSNLSCIVSSDISRELYKSSPHKPHTASEPAMMPSQEEKFVDSQNENLDTTEISSPSDHKRRRLQCHSLDDIDPRICTPPSPFKTPRGGISRHKSPKSRLASAWPMSPRISGTPPTPLSPLVLNSLWSNAPLLSNNDSTAVSPKSISFCQPTSSEKDGDSSFEKVLANVSLPIRTSNLNASRQMSCPVESKSPKVDLANSSNFSLDSSRYVYSKLYNCRFI